MAVEGREVCAIRPYGGIQSVFLREHMGYITVGWVLFRRSSVRRAAKAYRVQLTKMRCEWSLNVCVVEVVTTT